MVAWRMIGFPGAYASYYDLVDRHGIKIDRPPKKTRATSMSRHHKRQRNSSAEEMRNATLAASYLRPLFNAGVLLTTEGGRPALPGWQ
jgi:hypothetical protein